MRVIVEQGFKQSLTTYRRSGLQLDEEWRLGLHLWQVRSLGTCQEIHVTSQYLENGVLCRISRCTSQAYIELLYCVGISLVKITSLTPIAIP